MKLPVKKIWIILGTIILLFIFLNPGINRFKEFKGNYTYHNIHQYRRESNYLVFSIYTYDNEKYIGLLMNFINITPSKRSKEPLDSVIPAYYPILNTGEVDQDWLMRNIVYKSNRTHHIFTKEQILNSGYNADTIRNGVYEGILVPFNYETIKNSPKLILWIVLAKKQLPTTPFEEFEKEYGTIEKINGLYHGLFEDQLYTKTIADFFKQYFPDIKRLPSYEETAPLKN